MPFYPARMNRGQPATTYWLLSWMNRPCREWIISSSVMAIERTNLVIQCSSRNQDGSQNSGTNSLPLGLRNCVTVTNGASPRTSELADYSRSYRRLRASLGSSNSICRECFPADRRVHFERQARYSRFSNLFVWPGFTPLCWANFPRP